MNGRFSVRLTIRGFRLGNGAVGSPHSRWEAGGFIEGASDLL